MSKESASLRGSHHRCVNIRPESKSPESSSNEDSIIPALIRELADESRETALSSAILHAESLADANPEFSAPALDFVPEPTVPEAPYTASLRRRFLSRSRRCSETIPTPRAPGTPTKRPPKIITNKIGETAFFASGSIRIAAANAYAMKKMPVESEGCFPVETFIWIILRCLGSSHVSR
jgi:hypothetical protein